MKHQIKLKNLLITIFLAVFLSVSFQAFSQDNFLNVAGTWRYDEHDGWTRTRATVKVSQGTNGEILGMSGTISYHRGWDNFDWEVSNAWQYDRGEFTWDLVVRHRLGWGSSAIWEVGPFPVIGGSVSFSPSSEETASFQLGGSLSESIPNHSRYVASYTTFGSDLIRATRDALIEVEENEEILVSVSASPDTIWIDRAGVSSGITFTAITRKPLTVSFKVRGPDGSTVNVGSKSSAGAPDNCKASLSWRGSSELLAGNYQVIAKVSAESRIASFKVERAKVDFVGIGLDLGSNNKNPTNSAPPPPPEKDKCPPPYGQLPTALSGHPSGISVADPVNIVSGNFFLSETDMRLKSRIPLQLIRNYNSIVKDKTLFGRGWTSLFSAKLILSDSHVVFVNADGSRILFVATGDTYTPTAGHDAKLTRFDSTGLWSVAVPQGNEWFFDADGKIIRMVNSCCGGGLSDSVDFEYGDNGLLSKVINPAGQSLQFTYSEDLVTTITDSSGRTCLYTYNEDSDLISFTDPANRVTTYSYDESGFLTQIEKPGNITTAVQYTDGKVSKITNPDESINTFTWDTENKKTILTDGTGVGHVYAFNEDWQFYNYSVPSAGLTSSITLSQSAVSGKTDSLGNNSFYQYDSDGYLTAVTDPTGFVTTYQWHPTLKKLTGKIDALDRIWSYEWCARGNLVKETDPAGHETTYTYDARNNRTSKTDPLGRVTRYVYDSTGNYLIQTIDAMGGISSFTYDTRGNMTSSADQLGRTTTYEYDLLDRLVKTTYPDGRFTQFIYDEAGNIASRVDNLGRVTAYTYDANGRLLATTRPDGTTLAHSYDASGRKVSSTDALGRVTAYEYDALDNMIRVTYPDQSYQTYIYDTEKQLISTTDELGNQTTYEYGPMGRMLATIDPAGSRYENQYDAAGRKVAAKDPLGRFTNYQYDVLDRVVITTAPDSTTNTREYDAVGNLLVSTNALNQQTVYEYDALNRQVKTILANTAQFLTSYDAAGQVISETDALGNLTLSAYDNAGRRISTTNALNHIWQYVYDNAGRLIRVVDPMGGVVTNTYDIMNRIVSETDALGRVTAYEYDSAGKRIAKTDALGRRSIYGYDTRDRLTVEVDGEGRMVSHGYDVAGRKVRLTDGAGRIWRWTYDSLGRVTAEIDPIGNEVKSSYDAVGNLILKTNARAQATGYEYDLMNRLTNIIYPDATIATFGYDALGREVIRSGEAGAVEKAYDAVGNLVSEIFVNQNKGWSYIYDLIGNRTQATSPENETFKYRYDKLNRLVELESGNASEKVVYAYDALGRTIEEKRIDSTTANTFDPAGQLLEMKHYKLVVDHKPDSFWNKHNKGKPKKPAYKEEILALRQYGYDLAGNRISMIDENDKVTSYAYDGSNWLTQVVYPNADVISYTYNGAGDRLTEQLNDEDVVIYEYDAAGQMIAKGAEAYSYDADGNMLSDSEASYTWNSDNRLTRVEKHLDGCKHDKDRKGHGYGHLKHDKEAVVYEEYAYLPQDWRRIKRTTGNHASKVDHKGRSQGIREAEQVFVSIYDGDDESHEYLLTAAKIPPRGKHGRGKESLQLVREFVGGPGTDDITHARYGKLSFTMLKDGLGSTVALTGRDGKVIANIGYDAWGNFRFESKPGKAPCKDDDFDSYLNRLENTRGFGHAAHNSHAFGKHFATRLTPYLYTGRRYSSFTRQYFNRNRYYSPALGRFTTKDPIGFNGGNNLYRYGDNNPVLFIDPFGFITISTQTEADQVKAEIVNQKRNAKLIALLFAYWNPGDSFETTLFNDDWVKSMGFDVKNPDAAGYAADASGSRGKHYEKSPQIIKNAIDEMEASVILNASHLSRFVFQSEWFLNRYHGGAYNNEKFMMIWVINEFERTQKTIEILQSGLDAWEKCNYPPR